MPPVQRRLFTVTHVIQETPVANTLRFEPVDGSSFSFIPGQWVNVAIVQPDGTFSKETRPYSIASSATDTSGFDITFTIVGKFTSMLSALKEGAKVAVMGPFGHFQFREQEIAHAVFLAGGIGVTPLMGMARYATDKKLPTPITFFYSNRTREGTTFFDALHELAKRNPHLDLKLTYTQPDTVPEGWTGERGRINKDMIVKYVPDYASCTFFVCGPLKMTQDLAAMLRTEMNIPSERIKVEGWG